MNAECFSQLRMCDRIITTQLGIQPLWHSRNLLRLNTSRDHHMKCQPNFWGFEFPPRIVGWNWNALKYFWRLTTICLHLSSNFIITRNVSFQALKRTIGLKHFLNIYFEFSFRVESKLFSLSFVRQTSWPPAIASITPDSRISIEGNAEKLKLAALVEFSSSFLLWRQFETIANIRLC